MCFICGVLIALTFSRLVIRLLLYGLGIALLAALAEAVRAALLRDGLAILGAVGLVLIVSATVSSAVVGRRGR
ncbi:hypothetical protein ACFCY8_10405 [Streptomyces noursei]|uniref:hypothetical protein n=1 Tax=Streptomyces noursei TaxID=1971 RepID=UPI0035E307A4